MGWPMVGWPMTGWPMAGWEPEVEGAGDIFLLDSEQGLQAGDQSVLRASIHGCNEDRVIAGDGSGHFGPGSPVDGHGDTLRRADRGSQHRQRRAGTLDPSD